MRLAIMAVHEAIAAEGLGERFAALARGYRAWLLETFGAGDAGGVPLVSGEAFDATWWNVVVHPETGEWQLIDREWRLELPVPADYVLRRMLTAFCAHHAVQLGADDAARPRSELVAGALEQAGADVHDALIDGFQATEDALVRAIQGGELPGRRCEALEQWSLLGDAPRSFAVLAYADEVVERPALLAGYAQHFSAADPATLVLYAPGADEASEGARIEAAMTAAGLGKDAPDMILLTAAATDESVAAICANASALLSDRRGGGPFALLPRCGIADVAELRPYAETLWR